MDDRIREFAADAIIQSGGWNPRYAVILVDGNGDGAELELECWHRGGDGLWHGGSTAGHGPLASLPEFQTWNAGAFVAALGRARPGSDISVEYGGRVYRRRASDFGTWGFVHAANSPRPGELPAISGGSPPVA